MAKIIYQYMIDPKVNQWLEQKQKQYRHKTLSRTINWICKQNMILEKGAMQEQEKKQPKKNEWIGEKIREELFAKYD